jgi:hypothetical protein
MVFSQPIPFETERIPMKKFVFAVLALFGLAVAAESQAADVKVQIGGGRNAVVRGGHHVAVVRGGHNVAVVRGGFFGSNVRVVRSGLGDRVVLVEDRPEVSLGLFGLRVNSGVTVVRGAGCR